MNSVFLSHILVFCPGLDELKRVVYFPAAAYRCERFSCSSESDSFKAESILQHLAHFEFLPEKRQPTACSYTQTAAAEGNRKSNY